MKRNIFSKLKYICFCLSSVIIIAAVSGCEPVSDEAYYSALKATSSVPENSEEAYTSSESTETSQSSNPGDSEFSDSPPDFNSEPNIGVGSFDAEASSETVQPVITAPYASDAQPIYTDSLVIEAPYGLCYDLTDKVILYGKNIDTKIYPASITKLFTALVALEYAPDDFMFDIGSEIWLIETGSSVALLKNNQRLGLESILTALLVPSGNDAAYSIAVNLARYKAENSSDMSDSELIKYFAGMMNEYIKKLNLQNTHFTNPDGFHDDNHFSTLRDLLKISIAATGNPVIANICSQESPTVKYESGELASWESHLPLLGNAQWGVRGLKTGYTDESLYSYTALADINGKQYITIVSGCATSDQRINDTKKLLSLARDGYEEGTVVAYAEDFNN